MGFHFRLVEEGFEQILVFNGKPLGAFPIWHAIVSFWASQFEA